MKANRESPALTIAWMIGGFVLAIVALFSIFGAFVLVLLLMAATPFILGVLVVEAILGKKPVYLSGKQPAYVTIAEAEEKVLAPRPQEVLARPVTMQVISIEGTCPLGYQVNVGDVWALNGRLEGPAPLCPTARQKLYEYAGRARKGEVTTGEEAICRSNRHKVMFDLKPEKDRSSVVARR